MKTSCCHSTRIQKLKDQFICLNPNCENYKCSTLTLVARRWNKILFLSFFTFFTILSFNDFSSNPTNGLNTRTAKDDKKFCRMLNEENLKLVLNENHIICPEQVFAQIMIESGNLNSYLSKRTNNILGMRYPYKRETTAIGIYIPSENLIIKGSQKELKKYKKKNSYAVYEDWESCVKDYKHWQETSFNLTKIYLDFLGNFYAEDSMYVNKIKSISR